MVSEVARLSFSLREPRDDESATESSETNGAHGSRCHLPGLPARTVQLQSPGRVAEMGAEVREVSKSLGPGGKGR